MYRLFWREMTKLFPLALFVLFLSGCSENKGKKIETLSWKFDRIIQLDGISPLGIVAKNEFIWLSDVDNNRVVKIDFSGNVLTEYTGFQRPMHITMQGSKIYIPEYLSDTVRILEDEHISTYSLKEKPDAIGGVATGTNMVAIADFYNHRIILQQEGVVTIIGKEGHANGELYYPTDLEIRNNMIYVADAYNNRIQIFDLNGEFIKAIGYNDDIQVATGLKVTEGQIIVADFDGDRVLVYNLEGELQQILVKQIDNPTDIEVIEGYLLVTNYASKTISVYNNTSLLNK